MSFTFFFHHAGQRRPLALLLCATLAACGGGGGGDTSMTRDPVIEGPATPDDTGTVTGLRSDATDLLDDWAPDDVATYTALSAVPTTGDATYTGFLFGDLSDGDSTATDSLIGRLTLEVDFTASSATFGGSATEFVDSGDDPLTGTLTVSGGSLNRAGNPANDATLRGISVAGTLREEDGTALNVGVQLEGDFLGVGAEAVGGEAIGRVTVGTASQDFDGGFIAAE